MAPISLATLFVVAFNQVAGITTNIRLDRKWIPFWGLLHYQDRTVERWNGFSSPEGTRHKWRSWLPYGYSRISRLSVFGPSGFWTMAPLRYAAKFDPFLSLDCARVEGVAAQSKERKGSFFAA